MLSAARNPEAAKADSKSGAGLVHRDGDAELVVGSLQLRDQVVC